MSERVNGRTGEARNDELIAHWIQAGREARVDRAPAARRCFARVRAVRAQPARHHGRRDRAPRRAGRPCHSGGAGRLPSDLLLRRPDVVAAEQRLIAANARIVAADLSLIEHCDRELPALERYLESNAQAHDPVALAIVRTIHG